MTHDSLKVDRLVLAFNESREVVDVPNDGFGAYSSASG
jgi:hypothetical protein